MLTIFKLNELIDSLFFLSANARSGGSIIVFESSDFSLKDANPKKHNIDTSAVIIPVIAACFI